MKKVIVCMVLFASMAIVHAQSNNFSVKEHQIEKLSKEKLSANSETIKVSIPEDIQEKMQEIKSEDIIVNTNNEVLQKKEEQNTCNKVNQNENCCHKNSQQAIKPKKMKK